LPEPVVAETAAENPMTKLIAAAVSHAKKSNDAQPTSSIASPLAASVPAAPMKIKVHVKPIVHHETIETAAATADTTASAASLRSAYAAATADTTATAEPIKPLVAISQSPVVLTAAKTVNEPPIEPGPLDDIAHGL